MNSATLTFCGRCSHPMHWRECGAGAKLTAGPCRCRNDESPPASETVDAAREALFAGSAGADCRKLIDRFEAAIRAEYAGWHRHGLDYCDLSDDHTGDCWYESGTPDD